MLKQKGFTNIVVLLVIVALAAVGTAYYFGFDHGWEKSVKNTSPSSQSSPNITKYDGRYFSIEYSNLNWQIAPERDDISANKLEALHLELKNPDANQSGSVSINAFTGGLAATQLPTYERQKQQLDDWGQDYNDEVVNGQRVLWYDSIGPTESEYWLSGRTAYVRTPDALYNIDWTFSAKTQQEAENLRVRYLNDINHMLNSFTVNKI